MCHYHRVAAALGNYRLSDIAGGIKIEMGTVAYKNFRPVSL